MEASQKPARIEAAVPRVSLASENEPSVVEGVQPQLYAVDDLPESQLSDRISQLNDGELPGFVNPNNSTMPSDDGKLALKCLRALGTAGLSEDRKAQIIEALTPVISSKVGKKALKSLIGMEDPEARKLAASGFNTVKTSIASAPAGNEAVVDQTPQQAKKDHRHIKHDPTQKSLKILGNPDAKENEKEKAVKELLTSRMLSLPEEFIEGDVADILDQFYEGNSAFFDLHKKTRTNFLNRYGDCSVAKIEELLSAWEPLQGGKNASPDMMVIAHLQVIFLKQMMLLAIPDLKKAAHYAHEELEKTYQLLLRMDKITPENVDQRRIAYHRASTGVLAFIDVPSGLSRGAKKRFEDRLAIIEAKAIVLGQESAPSSSLERASRLLLRVHDQVTSASNFRA
ncbi:hypothetical protein HZB74_04060 [Candidatus Saccharibacteria bacterium]|nr:hypothetical protein [Candidatus Saccharibacteria bacterium]